MFEPRIHEFFAPLRGDARTAFDVARTALLSLGFEIVDESDEELHARGPGMQSNREPALLGASELELRVSASMITARATLGGVASMRAFVYLFPPGLALALGLTFELAEVGTGAGRIALLSVLPWLLISPLLARSMERKTERAVDRLVNGMASARAHSG